MFLGFEDFFNNSFYSSQLLKAKDKWTIEVEVPGLDKEDIKINLEDEVLELEIHNRNKTISTKKYDLGGIVDKDNIKSTLSKGILTIVLPQKAPAKKAVRTIAID